MAFGGTLICLVLVGCAMQAQAPVTSSDIGRVVMSETGSAQPPSKKSGRDILATSAAFATPTGRISCRANASGVRCEPTQKPIWTLERPRNCQAPHPTALRLSAAGVEIDCSTDSAIGAARLGTELTAWWRAGHDPQIRVSGVPQAALGYGSTIQVGGYVCTALQVGVACRDSRGEHGFEMSAESVRLR